jgi:phosphoribosylaminoimidazole carboxylase PurE protein
VAKKPSARAKKNKTLAKAHGAARVGVIMGSDSDLKVMNDAVQILTDFNVAHEVRIISAHRTPQAMLAYATEAEERGLEVIIAGAGGAAHLPGMVASATLLPVIGVPVNVTSLKGLDALLAVVQMPKGVPVATVAIDNAANAGLLAIRILANSDFSLKSKLTAFRQAQVKKVNDANAKLAKKNEL